MKQPLGQADHYDGILDEYERHYYDESSLAYRERYIYPTLFAGIDLSNRRVIELACGSGFNTQALLRRFPAAEPLGLDISPRSCEAYRRNTGRPAQVFDLTDPSPVDLPEPADCSFVVGGELPPEVGDGGNREGGISWGCLTTSLLHRRSDMPCPTITSSD